MKRIGTISCIVALSLCFMAAKACNTSDPYGIAGKAALDVANLTHVGADSVDQLRTQGIVTVDQEREALNALQQVNNLNGSYIGCVKTVHSGSSNAQSFAACASAFLTTTQATPFLASIHVSNKQTQEQVQSVLSSVQALLQGVISQLGSGANANAPPAAKPAA